MQTLGQSLQETILVVNTHSEALKAMQAVDLRHSIVAVDYAHAQLVSLLMSDMIRDFASSVDKLTMSRIPPYLVPLSLVQNIPTTTTKASPPFTGGFEVGHKWPLVSQWEDHYSHQAMRRQRRESVSLRQAGNVRDGVWQGSQVRKGILSQVFTVGIKRHARVHSFTDRPLKRGGHFRTIKGDEFMGTDRTWCWVPTSVTSVFGAV